MTSLYLRLPAFFLMLAEIAPLVLKISKIWKTISELNRTPFLQSLPCMLQNFKFRAAEVFHCVQKCQLSIKRSLLLFVLFKFLAQEEHTLISSMSNCMFDSV